jgi:hypothetical protein
MRVLLLPLFLLVFWGCRDRRIVSEQELKAYVMEPENGLRQKVEKNGVDIEVIYRPTELVLAQQLDGIADQRERTNAFKKFDSLTYFIIKFSREGQEIENGYVADQAMFVNVINYLSSSIASNFYVMCNQDTIRAFDAVYARMFGSATSTSVMVVFNGDLSAKKGKLKFFFDDTLLGLGLNKFEFDISDIKKAPTLNLN